jgi:hypothetical protein
VKFLAAVVIGAAIAFIAMYYLLLAAIPEEE